MSDGDLLREAKGAAVRVDGWCVVCDMVDNAQAKRASEACGNNQRGRLTF